MPYLSDAQFVPLELNTVSGVGGAIGILRGAIGGMFTGCCSPPAFCIGVKNSSLFNLGGITNLL